MDNTKALTPAEDEALKEWQSENVVPMSKTNFIKLDNTKFDSTTEAKNPNFGKITAVSFENQISDSKEIPVGTVFFPVRTRVQIACRDFDTDSNGMKKARYWCKETDRGEDIELKDQEGNVVYKGDYKGAKEQYRLKYKTVVYVYYEGKIYKWRLGGMKTLGSWFDVMNAVNKKGYPYYIVIKSVKEEKTENIYWNNVEFGLGEKFDVVTAVALGRKVEEELSAQSEKHEEVKDAGFEEDALLPLGEASIPPGFTDEEVPDFLKEGASTPNNSKKAKK